MLEREGGGAITLRAVGIVEAAAKAELQKCGGLKVTDDANDSANVLEPQALNDCNLQEPESADCRAVPPAPAPAPVHVSAVQSVDEIPEESREHDAAIRGLKEALDGGTPCVLPVALLAEWTDGFDAARRLGGGAFGDVFLASPGGLPRIAVKRLSPNVRLQGAAEDVAAALACVRREVRVLGAFRHPNIIRLLGYTEAAGAAAAETDVAAAGRPGELCLAFELAPRGGLDDNIRGDAAAADLTWRVRVRIAAGLARAINFLHCHDPAGPAFHRDVKSANVALTLDLAPKLIDCGLAKYAPDGPAGASAQPDVAGAPAA